ncbi:MFS polyamine transporter [Mycena polygramma]|nr:MFS polyamine transporter [Mycena polygramma]
MSITLEKIPAKTPAFEGPLIADGDGPVDKANPWNWSAGKKWIATILIASLTCISPLTSSIIAPASEKVAEDFGVHNSVVIALFTSIFVLAYAFGPLLIGPMSELYGRSRVIQIASTWYIAFNLACSFSKTAPQLLVFRFLAGLGGSALPAIGGGVIGDIWAPAQRGRPMAIYSLTVLLGPVLGPICGAWIAERSTWRWVFWATTIVDGMLQILAIFFLPESYAPLLLQRKAMRIRKSLLADLKTEPGLSIPEVRSKFGGEDRSWQYHLRTAAVRPFQLLVSEPILQVLGLYMAFIYGTLYLFLTSMPLMFQHTYGETLGVSGLNYIALGLGLISAAIFSAYTMDRFFRYYKENYGGVVEPEFRLTNLVPGTIILPIGLLVTGWSAQYALHWIIPDVGIALIGVGIFLNFQSIQIYIVDVFTLHAASSMGVISFLRSLAGFGFPLLGPAMYEHLGYGKGDTILAAIAVAVGCPAPWMLWKYGKAIRKRSRYAKHQAAN